jgi:hypothetical protein
VEFVDDEMKDVRIAVLLKPLPSTLENIVLNAPHEHDVQHAVVRDQNVGGFIMHVPPRPHFRALRVLEEIKNPRIIPISCRA